MLPFVRPGVVMLVGLFVAIFPLFQVIRARAS
jgi:hypothetical protein